MRLSPFDDDDRCKIFAAWLATEESFSFPDWADVVTETMAMAKRHGISWQDCERAIKPMQDMALSDIERVLRRYMTHSDYERLRDEDLYPHKFPGLRKPVVHKGE